MSKGKVFKSSKELNDAIKSGKIKEVESITLDERQDLSKKSFEERFLLTYKEAERLGYKDYFVGVYNNVVVTWEDVKTMIDFKIRIPKKQREDIEMNLKVFFISQKNKESYLKALKKQGKKNE